MGSAARRVRTAAVGLAGVGVAVGGTYLVVDSLESGPDPEHHHVIIRGRLPDSDEAGDHADHDMTGNGARADAELVVTAGPGPEFSLSRTAFGPEDVEDGAITTWVESAEEEGVHDLAAGDPVLVDQHGEEMGSGEGHHSMPGMVALDIPADLQGTMIDIPVAPDATEIAGECFLHPGMDFTVQITGRS